jgi:multimeric flavodoxin WrbA
MRIVVSDILDLHVRVGDELKTPDSTKKLHHCIGCFGCWIKTPGQCVIKDQYADMGKLLGHSRDFVLVSKCTYGGVSPFVQNVLDRSLPNLSPDFTVRGKEQHHKLRYDNIIRFSAYFYGTEVTEKEKDTAVSLINAIALNFGFKVSRVSFFNTPSEVKEAFI